MYGKKMKAPLVFLCLSVKLLADDFRGEVDMQAINKEIVLKACEGCETVDVSLNGLINEVVKRNYNLYAEKMKVSVAEHKVSLEEGIFEPKFSLSSSYRRTDVPNSAEQTLSRGFQDNYRDRVRDISSSVSGLLETGGEWSLGFTDRKMQSNLISETQSYDTEYSNGFNLSLKQPLLRGMGTDVTYAKINMAKIGIQINATEYKNKLMNLIATTIRLYWRLYGTQKLYENWTNTLSITEGQLKNIRLLAQYGKVPESEILEAKSSIFQKKTELLSLKSTISEIKSQLLSLLNISGSSFSSTLFIVKDIPTFSNHESILDIDKSYEKAIENLPELKLAQLKLATGKLEQKYSENQLLPDLSFVTNVSTLGLSDIKNNSYYCSTGCNDQLSWDIGLNLEIPLYGNKSAQENLKISKLNLRNSELAIESFNKEIYNAITVKIEQLKSEELKLNEYVQEVGINKELLKIERKKLELGRGRMRDVLEYETRLMQAQRKMFSSIVNFKVSEALLNKTTGELLKKQNIELSFNDDYQKNSEKFHTKNLSE